MVGYKVQGARVCGYIFPLWHRLLTDSPAPGVICFSTPTLQYSNKVRFYLKKLNKGIDHINWRSLGTCFVLALIWALLRQRVC